MSSPRSPTAASPSLPSSLEEEGSLSAFRQAQRLAYRCAEEVSGRLVVGTTEREAASWMKGWLLEQGVEGWFHTPFAWFGDRTAFRGVRFPWHFFPTERRLEEGMPYILDVAPVVDGHPADIGYSGCLGENASFELLASELGEYRTLILAGVRSGRTFRQIYEDVDALLTRHGFENCHRRYPGRVLGHRVQRVGPRVSSGVLAGFGLQSLHSLGRELLSELRVGRSPLWAGGALSDHPPRPGVWAVEPHLGFRDVGVKFEELLVITAEGEAFWLDEDLPHNRRRAG